MKRVVALAAVLVIVLSIAPIAHAEQYATLYATQPVNIRSGPSTNYAIIGELKTGNAVQYLDKSGNWYIINYNGLVGYVYGKYLAGLQAPVTPPTGTVSYVVAQTNVNVRSGPSTKYGKLGAILYGQSAQLLGTSGNWYKIQWGSGSGYVYKKYFTVSSTATTNPTYPSYPGTPVYPSYPTYPGYPAYPTYPYYDTQNSEFFTKLDNSGYFTANAGIYMGRFTDSQGIPNIRVANGTNLNKVAEDLKSLLKKPGTFRLAGSSLPVGVNLAYLNYYISQWSAIYQGLTASQKAQLPVVGMAYDAARDAVVVQISGVNSDKINLFKTWISSWAFLQFEGPSYYYMP